MSWSDAAARRAVPFRQYILKVHSRCDLACSYCFMYADDSWRAQPRVMPEPVLAISAQRIADHVQRHDLAAIEVVLHGGEPLLAGAAGLARCVSTMRAAVRPETAITFAMQTNGRLLDEPMLSVLDGLGVRVAVSLDGPAAVHDRRRLLRDGGGSFAAVAAALGRLNDSRFRHMFSGLICVIDPDADPMGTLNGLLQFAPPQVDFLLPHANWTAPPSPVGDWLCALFDHWYDAPARQTRVRLFEEIINLILGGQSRTEQIGLSPAAMIVVATDGGLEQVDTLRSAYAGAAETGMTVFRNTLDEALAHPAVASRQLGEAGLCATCRGCPIRKVCGGGHYAHRYRPENGFDNPSVYCSDLRRLIGHITGRLHRDLTRIRSEAAVA